jgi:hypothetical protein
LAFHPSVSTRCKVFYKGSSKRSLKVFQFLEISITQHAQIFKKVPLFYHFSRIGTARHSLADMNAIDYPATTVID